MLVENPNKYITPNCFDVAAKILYAKHYKLCVVIDWSEKYATTIYGLGIKAIFTNITELKIIFRTLKKYNLLLNNLINNGFDEIISKIPVANKEIINGAHRLGACVALGKEIYVENVESPSVRC